MFVNTERIHGHIYCFLTMWLTTLLQRLATKGDYVQDTWGPVVKQIIFGELILDYVLVDVV